MLSQTINTLKSLHLSGMANRLKAWHDDPVNQAKSQLECVLALAEAQANARLERKLDRFQTASKLPPNTSVSAVRSGEAYGLPRDLWANLKQCGWLKPGQNVVITGPGGSGKSLIAGGLARETIVCHPKARVVFRNARELIAAVAALSEVERVQEIRRLGRVDLLVLDRFAGYTAPERDCQILQHIIDARHLNQVSTVVASPYPLEEWASGFDDKTAAESITWRLLERSHRLALPDPSTRA